MSLKFPKSAWLLVSVLPLSVGQMCVPKSPLPGDDGDGGVTQGPTIPINHPAPPPAPPVPPPPIPAPQPRSDANSYLLYLLDESQGTKDATITLPPTSALPVTNDNPEGNSFTVGREADGTLQVTFFKFNLDGLPRTVQAVQLNLILLDREGTANSIYVDRLTGPWEENGTLFPGWVTLGYWTIENTGFWKVMNLTSVYRNWVNGLYSNHGIMMRPNPNILGPCTFVFGSSENNSVLGVPLLEIWGVRPGPAKFRFPLTGKYSPARVTNGYRFGQPWESKTCLGTTQPLLHTGTDFAAQFGDLVFTVEEGVVVYSEASAEQGGYLAMEHQDENGWTWTSVFEHVTPLYGVVVGTTLARGSFLGRVVPGTAGYGPHLHFHGNIGRFILPWSIRGRFPATPCTTEKSPTEPEPALNSLCFDPETMDWEQ